MNEVELIGFLCFCLPPIFAGLGFFAASLLFTARDADTRRYPRYGESADMRTKDKFRVKSRYGDKET